MADAARPTPRGHARTPLSRSSTRGEHRRRDGNGPIMPQKSFSELLNYYLRATFSPPRSSSRHHGAPLGLSSFFGAEVRSWRAQAAVARACSCMLGSTDMILIAIGAARHNLLAEGFWLPLARGAAASLLLHGAARGGCSRTSERPFDGRARGWASVAAVQSTLREDVAGHAAMAICAR